MIPRAKFIEDCAFRGDVKEAFDHLIWRAVQLAEVPQKTVDFWADLRICLNRAIQELCDARNSM